MSLTSAEGKATAIDEAPERAQETACVRTEVTRVSPHEGRMQHSRSDIGAVSTKLGFSLTRSLAEGLRQYVAWLRQKRAYWGARCGS